MIIYRFWANFYSKIGNAWLSRRGGDVVYGSLEATAYKVGGVQVVGARRPAIANAAVGTEVATINAILAAMRTHGLVEP